MKVIERSTMKDGTKIQLEDWTAENWGFMIGAYPIAKNSSRYNWIERGRKFRLSIGNNSYKSYTDEDVKADYKALIDGEKTLQDLANYFWNGKRDMFYLGMIGE